ncbi:MAG: polysaccharide deacetylase [Candidatus Omnitrophota bacterium]|nr:MAG: polysaccharide deacetylase [Candidatus Omnitrophota bacterium]
MKNVLTIDVEGIEHSRFERCAPRVGSFNLDLIDKPLVELLNLLDRFDAKATFFILGEVAESMPELVRLIYSKGHEVASHGYRHHPVYLLKPEEFREDLLRSKEIIEDIIGERILGYRAPYWSITDKNLWAMDIIKSCGLLYDSSISPAVNFLYGMKSAERITYFHSAGFWEVPPTTLRILNKVVIVAGGFYLRALPYWLTKNYVDLINKKKRYAIFYLHPHELLNYYFKEKFSLRENFILNYKKHTFRNKLFRALEDFKFQTLREALALK